MGEGVEGAPSLELGRRASRVLLHTRHTERPLGDSVSSTGESQQGRSSTAPQRCQLYVVSTNHFSERVTRPACLSDPPEAAALYEYTFNSSPERHYTLRPGVPRVWYRLDE